MQARPEAIVIVHTALPEEFVRLNFDGYDAFLGKPASTRTMLSVLPEMLERREYALRFAGRPGNG